MSSWRLPGDLFTRSQSWPSALRNCELTAQVSTKLNRSHVVHGRQALILPCLGRTDKDRQAGGEQGVTVEDAMSMVHISVGMKEPPSPQLRSECAVIAGLAQATLLNVLCGIADISTQSDQPVTNHVVVDVTPSSAAARGK